MVIAYLMYITSITFSYHLHHLKQIAYKKKDKTGNAPNTKRMSTFTIEQ